MESDELISFEAKSSIDPGMYIRIEARYNGEGFWDIIKTYYDSKSINFTEEYKAKTKEEALHLIQLLKDKAQLTKEEIKERKLRLCKEVEIKLKRCYKDYNIEKWKFSVNKGVVDNFVFVKEGDVFEVDIILEESYKPIDYKIIAELYNILGLHNLEFDIQQNIFFYTKRIEDYKRSKQYLMMGRVEVDFQND